MKRLISILLFASAIAYIALCAANHAEQSINDRNAKIESVMESVQ